MNEESLDTKKIKTDEKPEVSESETVLSSKEFLSKKNVCYLIFIIN